MTRLTKLTGAHRAAIPDHVDHWVRIGQCTDPADWDAFTAAAAECYRYAGVPWPGRVVRVSSPLVLSLAAPIAAHILGQRCGEGDGAVDDAVRVAVFDAVGDAVRDAVDTTVRGAVGGAVGNAVRGAVGGAVRGAVGGAVDRAVRGEVDGAEMRKFVLDSYYRRLGGQWSVSWLARTSFYRDVCGVELNGDLWERDRAYATAQSSAGWWWPHQQFVMVCDRPRELHLEQVGPAGWGSHRLHCPTGPAISWRDGWSLHYWHGTRVPADLIEGDGWTPDRIMREPNTEIRRCAVEAHAARHGWDQLIATAGWPQIGETVPDPGNPGQTLSLYRLADVYDQPVHLLRMTNGTVERDGGRRQFGETVPASITDPVAAAAWQIGITRHQYAQTARRT